MNCANSGKAVRVSSRRLVIAAIPMVVVTLAGCADKDAPKVDTISSIDQVADRPNTTRESELPPFGGAGDRVLFDYDKATIRPDALPVLRGIAEWMKRHPDTRYIIEGHADERGTREYNLSLGARRASAVKAALLSLGVPQQQIADTISYGKERPAVVGSNEAAWAQNRRAVMVAQDRGAPQS